DVQQEVVATRDDEDADGLRQVGQQTNDYDDVRAYVARTATADLEYLGSPCTARAAPSAA
ncbi:MAG TPA: hypothetical protein VGC83_07940, partial [Solirubrobacteraceae bacterium]